MRRAVQTQDKKLAERLSECNRLLLTLKRECENYRMLESVSHIALKLMNLMGEMERFLEECKNEDVYKRQVQTKEETIDRLIDLMVKSGNISDRQKYREEVFKREKEGTTGIGEGIAIPHAKTEAVKSPGLAAMVVKDGVDYDSLDGQPVYLLFLIAAPNTEDNVHLEVLSRLSMLLMDENFRTRLMGAGSVEEFLSFVDEAEREKFAEEEQQAPEQSLKNGYQILAVTACPTGIAHTYMAAESLENTAKEMGCTIKVETNGSGGVKNALTPEEIAQCQCIIIAADKEVKICLLYTSGA